MKLSQDHKEALEEIPRFLHGPWLLYERVLESKKAANILIITLIVVFALALFIVGFLATNPYAPSAGTRAQEIAEVAQNAPTVFQCLAGKSIRAIIRAGSATLSLSDGREITLPETSDVKFSNPDSSFVFLRQGNVAYIMENGIASFKDCAQL